MDQTGKTRGPAPIQDVLKTILRQSGIGISSGDQRVFDAWNRALGSQASQAVPVRLRRGELTVEVSSSPLFHELRSFTGDDFRKNANRKLGTDTIRRVTFKLRG